ncbi:MAG: hypothetical protein KAT11_03165 [Phycisphaerae bacterium]|nr:hypothetical protein [Phycisphaerae bacterium]
MFSHPFRNRLGLLLGAIWFLGLSSTTLLAQDSRGLLDKAAQQIDARDYITAKETLDQIKPAQLSPADKDRLKHLIRKADYALEKAGEIRQRIAEAKLLAKQNDFVAARQKLEQALKSPRLDPAAQSRIKSTLTEIEARRKQFVRQMNDLFAKSVRDYKAGRLDQADKGFKTVIESGVDLGFWNRGKPQKYLKKIAQKRAKLPQQPFLQAPDETATIVIGPVPGDEQLEPVVEVPPPTQLRPVATEPDQAQTPRRVTTPGPGDTLIATEVKRRRIIKGQITFQHKIAMDRAEKLIQQHKFAEARRIVRDAQDTLANNQSILPSADMALMHTTGQARLAYINKQERIYQAAQAEQRRVQAQALATEAQLRAQQRRKERVKQLFSQGTTFIQDRKYQLALDRYIQVLNIDPNNPDARKLSGWLQDEIWLLKTQDIESSAETEYQQAIHNIREVSKPIDRDLTWDPNWPAISRRRSRAYTGIAQDTPENMEASRQLDVRYPRFDYQETPLSEVFDDLRAKSGLNIVPNWESLTTAGIEEDTLVSIQLHNVSLKRALKAILSSLSSSGIYGGTTVSYGIDDGIIVIATSEDLAAELKIVAYEIADLLVETIDRRGGPQYEPGGDDGRDGGGRDRSGRDRGGRDRGRGGQADAEEIREGLIEDILIFIQLVEPDSWQENGGPGTSYIWGTKLLIYQTADIHAKIRDMLRQIRDSRPIQISVEPRFIYVTDNFLEDIGVDFDLYLRPQGNWGGPSWRPVTLAGYPGQRVEYFNPMIGMQGSANWTGPAKTGIQGSIGAEVTGLTIAGSFLDALEVDFLIRATQASRQATTLMAPRVTFENAGSAHIYVGRDIWYVADVDVEIEDNAVGYSLVIARLALGPTLNVGGVVSPDRRFIRLDVEVTLNDLFKLPFVADIVPDDWEWFGPWGITQLPYIDRTSISTQVSVPDGGALLIGGVRRRTEQKMDAGVPVLNKIPWLKRFFSSTMTQDDKHVMLILLRPRIIDLMEEQGLTHPELGER